MYPKKGNKIIVPNQKKNGDCYKNPSLSYLRTNFDYKETNGKKSIYFQTKASISCTLMRRHGSSVQSQKDWRLLQESKFVSFKGQALILKKMVERKAILAKPKHQYHVSQRKKTCFNAQSQKE